MARMYTEDQWAVIFALGEKVDARLRAGDVRLTMGGEPTFVSAGDPFGAEWQTAALGPTKFRLAADLAGRLRERFAPGGVVHFGAGKWYPGEPLPRWAFSLYWRADGKPLWRDPKLFALAPRNETAEGADARRFMTNLAVRLGFGPSFVHKAYEDPVPYLAREQRLPENLDLLQTTLGDEDAYAGLTRVFKRGFASPVAWVLPIQWSDFENSPRWRSERWSFKRKRLYLVPGDHPAGHRLPMGSLPLLPPDLYPYFAPVDPFAERPPFEESGEHRFRSSAAAAASGLSDCAAPPFMDSEIPEEPVRRAICAEPREGLLNVFLPSMESADAFVDLVATIESTAAALRMPVRLEGYKPPSDPRLKSLSVTPDPGVIEVNLHPAHSWKELVDVNTGLFEDARQSGLTAEKFTLYGHAAGTGGGNHVTVGGPTPADSPFLRRPDLLRSVVNYWQRHPALSYLFSGLFVGPSSQAPRVDEARHEALYELELGFQQVPGPESGETAPPWLVDRLFRNLLIDVTGNTHRAELCIDKLYSPDSAQGRLGLVELRAFAMPPDPRLLLVQRLLIRALIVWFWERPVDGPLVRWGTALHDRFMLPHFIWNDVLSIIDDLAGAGIDFDPDWFKPQFDLRFPCFGRVTVDGVAIELRQALEPWLVLGEEPNSGGTSRPTDSSMDRLQVRVAGFNEDLHVLVCNGWRVPLHPAGPGSNTESDTEYVAGIRFRAWDNPSGLHPTLSATPTLTFELFDRQRGGFLGGCAYSVDRSEGKVCRTPPKDAREAEHRRRGRFRPLGPSASKAQPQTPPRNPDTPLTLDLRWT